MSNKIVTKNIKIRMTEDEFKILENFWDKHPELIKQVIYGQSILEKIGGYKNAK